jgi:hypothetical protein
MILVVTAAPARSAGRAVRPQVRPSAGSASTSPDGATRNFSKFHSASPARPAASGTAVRLRYSGWRRRPLTSSLEVIGNVVQFAGQEPGTPEETKGFSRTTYGSPRACCRRNPAAPGKTRPRLLSRSGCSPARTSATAATTRPSDGVLLAPARRDRFRPEAPASRGSRRAVGIARFCGARGGRRARATRRCGFRCPGARPCDGPYQVDASPGGLDAAALSPSSRPGLLLAGDNADDSPGRPALRGAPHCEQSLIVRGTYVGSPRPGDDDLEGSDRD